ncbi:FtsQ-type POTRA domain-containing protein [Rhodoluna sp.]|uniref:FtsQ-type POTRA domain-containing protein n=1 Tax=Rhodoluna sp. TaxID=1969481 RepID=UPI0025D5F860|nr:FtsQ-type POTRA domain-containing protein [Rhodoluna sp.]
MAAATPKAPQKITPINRKVVKRESKRLTSIKKYRGKSAITNRLSAEARRFTAHTRQRRIITISVVASVGTLILLVLATMFTPLLAVEKLEVTGTKRLNSKSIVNALISQMGKPLPLINSGEIQEKLKTFELVESFSLVSLPPHTLRVQIVERQPISIIYVAGTAYLYDPAGVRVGRATSSDTLPTIRISGDPKNNAQFKAAIDVLLALPASLLPRVSEIDAKTKDDVTLSLRGYAGQRIIWGDGSQSVLKSKALAALIKNQKTTDNVTFDVSSPDAPTVSYGNF